MIKIFKNLRSQEWALIALVMVFIVLQVWLDLTMPDYMADITRMVQTDGSTMSEMLTAGGKMLLCALGSLLAAVLTAVCAAKIATGFAAVLRGKLFAKVQSFSMEEIGNFSTASLITRSTNDITQVQMLIVMGLEVLLKAPIMAVWALCKISTKNWQWTASTGVAVVVLLSFVGVCVAVALPKFKKLQSLTDNLNRVTRENLTGLNVVRAYNAEGYQQKKFNDANDELTKTQLFANRTMGTMMPGIQMVMNGLMLAIYWIGAYLISNAQMFDKLVADQNYRWNLRDILPKVLAAGEEAGVLTEEGAALLDPSGDLQAGIPLCPPEGDAGTGMVATNSVAKRTGNISAGTSIFAMVVLEKELSKVYPQIDLVTTPDGALVGMVHCNNCTSDINAWVNLFREFGEMYGLTFDMNDLFTKLYSVALKGDPDCGGMISYNYFSGEPVTGFDAGAPLFVRDAESKFTLANTMRMHLYSALAALKSGMDLMLKEEGVQVDQLFGHGGYFKTKGVGQRIAAAAMNAPVSVMETAGEGGAWGIAVLAAFLAKKKDGQSLGEFLNEEIFAGNKGVKMDPVAEDVEGFEKFMEKYMKNLPAEKAAVEAL